MFSWVDLWVGGYVDGRVGVLAGSQHTVNAAKFAERV